MNKVEVEVEAADKVGCEYIIVGEVLFRGVLRRYVSQNISQNIDAITGTLRR